MSSKINLQPCEYARKSSIFQDNQLISQKTNKTIHNEMRNIPVLGTVAAGQPILAKEFIESYLPVPATLFSPHDNIFALQVRGTSMVNANILDGDKILVKQQSSANNGTIVVALIDDAVTVKRFFKENGYYRLQPENESMEPIIVDHVEILGVVKGLFRMMM